MHGSGGSDFKIVLLRLPWVVLRFFGRTIRWFFVAVGVLAALTVLGYVEFESIIRMIDDRYANDIDTHLGIDRNAIARLNDRAYFAQQSMLVTEDLKTVACISSPEHRILIDDAADIPPLFVNAILASEDRNFLTHEGVDKAAIVRALVKRILQDSRSGASTLPMQIAKHLRGGTGRASTEIEKVGDIVMALRIEREFSRQDLLLKYVNMPYFGRGQYGIEAASRAYFGKPAKELALPQVAFIVSLINKPALPDRSFATDPLLRTREQIRDANWAASVRGTMRVLDLMLDEGAIDEVEHARASNRVGNSLRSDVLPQGIGLRHARPLSRAGPHPLQGPIPDQHGRAHDLDHARRRAAGRPRPGGPTDAAHLYRASSGRSRQQPAARRGVRGRVHRQRARRGRQCRLQAIEVRRDRDRLAPAGIDVQDLHLRWPGRATHLRGARHRAEAGDCRSDRDQRPRALHGARCTGIRFAGPRPWREEDRELPLALGAGVPRRDHLPDRAGRVPQHGGDARRRAGRNQERDRSQLSPGHAQGPETSAAAVSDDGHWRLRGQSAVDGIDGGVPERRISRDAALRQRRLPVRQVTPLYATTKGARRTATSGAKTILPRSGSCIPRYRRR